MDGILVYTVSDRSLPRGVLVYGIFATQADATRYALGEYDGARPASIVEYQLGNPDHWRICGTPEECRLRIEEG